MSEDDKPDQDDVKWLPSKEEQRKEDRAYEPSRDKPAPTPGKVKW